jgi:hypothetical protein
MYSISMFLLALCVTALLFGLAPGLVHVVVSAGTHPGRKRVRPWLLICCVTQHIYSMHTTGASWC